jgi:hypothetical protein
MVNASQTVSAVITLSLEIDISAPFSVFAPQNSETPTPTITFGSIKILVPISPFTYAPRAQNLSHISTTATTTSNHPLHVAPMLNNPVMAQPQGSAATIVPTSIYPLIPPFAYSSLNTPYQGTFPTVTYATPAFPAPFMSMVSPEVWRASQLGWMVNPEQATDAARLEELRTRLAFPESATTTIVSTNPGTIP